MSKISLTESEITNRHKIKNSIYFIEGEKFFTRCLVDYFISRGWNSQFTLVEADSNIDDVSRVYPNLYHDNFEKTYFSDSKYHWHQPNIIIDKAEEKTVVANLPSNTYLLFDLWLDQLGFPSYFDFQDYFNKVIYFFVSDGGYFSIQIFLNLLEEYPKNKLSRCLVLNLNRVEQFEQLEKFKPLIKAIEAYQIPVLIFPKLDSSLQFECELENLSYKEFGVGKSLDFQRKATRFSERIDLLFGNIFPLEINDPQGLQNSIYLGTEMMSASAVSDVYFGR